MVLSPLQRLDVAGEFMDAFGRDDLAAGRSIEIHVILKELAAPDRHLTLPVAWHREATIDHREDMGVRESPTVPVTDMR